MRAISTIVVSLIVFTAFSQKSKVITAKLYLDQGDYIEAQKLIDESLSDEETSADSKTWKYRGDIYYSLYASGKSKDLPTIETAAESYMKAMSIDNHYKNDIKRNCRMLGNLALNEGVQLFNQKNYDEAIRVFTLSVDVSGSVGFTDSLAIYNVALANERAGNTAEAIRNYQHAIDIGYKAEDCYTYIIYLYQQAGDTENMKRVLTEARGKYPGNQHLLITAINIGLTEGRSDDVVKMLEEAVKNDSENKTLYFTLGSTYDALKQPDNAEKAYKNALAIDPNYFDALYNLGALYFNDGVEMNNLNINEKDPDTFLENQKKTDALFEKAQEQLEKAYKINPEDYATIESLKQIYARSGNTEKYQEMKEKLGQ